MATGDISQGLIPDLPRDPQILDVDKRTINPVWSLFFDQLILTLQTVLTPEGTVMPQQPSSNVDLLTAPQSIGNILYNNTTNNFEGNINNPDADPAQAWWPFSMILTGSGSPVGVVAGTSYNFYWDTTNQALWICTVTGDAASATWVEITFTGGTGTVTSITAGTGLTASPTNPITTSGTLSITPVISAGTTNYPSSITLNAQGQVTSITPGSPPSGGTVTSVTGTSGQITVIDNTTTPIVSIDPTYAGQTSITTLGTIGTGVWNGTTIVGKYGGTGINNNGLTINLGSGSSGFILTSDSSGNATWQSPGYLTGAVLLNPSAKQTISTYNLEVTGLQLSTNNALYDSNGNIILGLLPNASAVNYISAFNNVTGMFAGFQAQGSDSNVGMTLFTKGTGVFGFNTSATSNQFFFNVGPGGIYNNIFNFPSADNIFTWPNATGTVALTSQIPTISLTASTGITLTPSTITGTGTIGISNTAVTAGTYTEPNSVTVNAQGQITAITSGTYPKARATMSTTQSISTSSLTKIAFNTATFDTNSNYSTTNYRFTPTVAGYYLVTGAMYINTISTVETIAIVIYKNGSQYSVTQYGAVPGFAAALSFNIQDIVSMNGSTDYLEIWCGQTAGSTQTLNPSTSFLTATTASFVTYHLLP